MRWPTFVFTNFIRWNVSALLIDGTYICMYVCFFKSHAVAGGDGSWFGNFNG